MLAALEQDPLSNEEIMQRQSEIYNRSAGTLNLIDGYDCPDCKNRGDFETEDGGLKYCACKAIRDNIKRLKRSGLEKSIESCTFDSYETKEPWQRRIKETALAYCADVQVNASGSRTAPWFFAGGAIGAGKTHICTAIAGQIMKRESLIYVLWNDESARLKGIISDDSEGYDSRMNTLKTVESLYIDDLFKITREGLPPTAADVRLAYELINYRYVNYLRTLISSERTLIEVCDLDQAIGGRIRERTKGFCLDIARDIKRDYRLRNLKGA